MSEIAYSISIIALSIVAIVAIVGITIYNMDKIHLKLEGIAKISDDSDIGLKMGLTNNIESGVSQSKEI